MDYSRFPNLQVDKADGIATVTLNRPDVLNAISGTGDGIGHLEMEDIWLALADDAQVNVIVLTGAGRTFSAGGNVKAMADRHGTELGWSEILRTARGAKRLLSNILEVPQPIVTAMNGHAMGLGATIGLFTDTVVISETAKIGDTHVRVGLVAGDGGTVLWPLLLGVTRAKEFLMRGRVIDGREAERIGLVNYAVPAEQVLPKAMEIAQDINSLPPLAVRWTKLTANLALKNQFNAVMDGAIAYECLSMNSADHGEATRAFVDKRPGKFRGL
ncbi:MAG: enoyl-CoA hydratase/isomerase family protein [Gammaproteobacteria bacterium]